MYKWFKVLITDINCALPLDIPQDEADAFMAAKRAEWPAVLEFEIECDEGILDEKLNEVVSEKLGVGINTISYQVLDWEFVGQA